MESAAIFYKDKKAGTLYKMDSGYEFLYEENYLKDPASLPVSLSLPLQKEPYRSTRLFPFFEGLLPEGWLLRLTCSTAKIDQNDKFHLLLHTGLDPVGAVKILPLEQ